MKFNISIKLIGLWLCCVLFIAGCTKYQNGFLSSTMQYSVSTFNVTRGVLNESNSLVSDGSSLPIHIEWTHIYDSTGAVVDSLFKKTYPVRVWTSSYNSKTDTTYAQVIAKQSTSDLTPIEVNPTSGVLEANSATLYIPVGTYTMDLKVTNKAGVTELKKAMTIIVRDGLTVSITPETGNFSVGLAYAGTTTTSGIYNGVNNPFVDWKLIRYSDTPNVFVLKFTDRDGVPFSPKSGEVIKRPTTGTTTGYLQNLQDYAPDTYLATDTALQINYPVTPFPITSLGNGYNMYYEIAASAVLIDSTSSWTSNTAGLLYQGTSDSHYRGVYPAGKYDYPIRVPMRILVPGSYELVLKILNTTHR